ncbi:MAG: hypothetical protein Q8M24_05550 [Pseudolabrys sp.]|nr:hypothetical protein [Pseudolabrys sp.]MDP2294911.1 hypothetical protein [Pseudolabrys sp.]
MASLAHPSQHHHAQRHHRKRQSHQRQSHQRKGHNPLAAPVLLFAAVCIVAAVYVAYVLWPRWPDVAVATDAPLLPITIAGIAFNIEPAAIRIPVQRHAGTQNRVDLAYLWPSLVPPDPAIKIIDGAPVDPNERLFATIQVSDGTMPLNERVQTIYPRYLGTQKTAGADGLTLQPFRDGTPYQGEELVFDQAAPEHFLARCSRKGFGNSGITNSGTCLTERRVGSAEIILRFPRDWLNDWRRVAAGIDKLMTRWRPAN